MQSALIVPLIGAGLVVLTGRWPNVREAVSLVTATILFVQVLSLYSLGAADSGPLVSLAEPMPGLPIALQLEPLGMLFALLASLLWIVTTVYAIGYMRGHDEKNQTRFYAAFAVSIAATMGVALSANLFTLFLFYEILTLSTYPLVTHAGTDEARRGGRIYLGLLLGTSIGLQLVAIIGTWHYAGTLDFRAGGILAGHVSPGVASVLLILFVLGVGKAATMPFHGWLPAAMVAPTPVSALLHAVAVVKAGVFTVLKVSAYIFGIDFLQQLPSTDWLLYLASATVLLASFIAMRQDNLKRRLAYSTVSQLGYIVVGGMLAHSLGLLGGAAHILTHAFGKITLFFAAGAILVAAHKTEISDMRGLGWQMPFTFSFFLIGALSIVGLPPFGGFWSKWYLMQASVETAQWLVLGVLMLSSLLNVLYLLPIPVRAFWLGPVGPSSEGLREAPLFCLLAMAVTASGCLFIFFLPNQMFELVGMLRNLGGG